MKKGWEYKTLGEVCEVIAGQSPEGRFYNHDGNGTPFYQGKKEFTDRYIGAPTTWTIVETKIAEENDILMSVRAPVGDINIATQRMCIGRGLAAIRHGKTILTKFLYHYLQSQKDNITGREGAVFPTINRQEIMSIYIPVPPLEEQKKVVLQLDKAFEKIDTLRHNAEKSLTTAQQLFQSSLTNLLTPQPHWQRKKFGEVCSYNKNQGRWSGLKYIGMEHIEAHTGILLDSSDSNTIESSSFKFQKGDLLYGRLRPYLQKVIIAPFEGCCSTEIFPIQSKLIIHCFLKYWFLTEKVTNMMVKSCSGCRMPRGDMNLLKEEMILFPPLSEQTAIVAKLDSLSAKVKQLKDNYTRTVALCDEMKQALLKEVFE